MFFISSCLVWFIVIKTFEPRDQTLKEEKIAKNLSRIQRIACNLRHMHTVRHKGLPIKWIVSPMYVQKHFYEVSKPLWVLYSSLVMVADRLIYANCKDFQYSVMLKA